MDERDAKAEVTRKLVDAMERWGVRIEDIGHQHREAVAAEVARRKAEKEDA